MDFLYINTQELSALMDLPLIQRVAYLMGIRPYMDGQTGVVGIQRKISYQSLREILYVAPIPGVKTESPSIQQVRRAVKSLEKAGLILIQSTEKSLILKCLLVAKYKFVQNKADIRSTPQADTRQAANNIIKSESYNEIAHKADTHKIAQADIPLNNNYLYILFEKFWETYPQKNSKPKAQVAFAQLNPDPKLFQQLMQGLQKQIKHVETMRIHGLWVPPWKYPANWLEQRCWEDEFTDTPLKEKTYGVSNKHYSKAPVQDLLWESCKSAITSDCEDSGSGTNIIKFKNYRSGAEKN